MKRFWLLAVVLFWLSASVTPVLAEQAGPQDSAVQPENSSGVADVISDPAGTVKQLFTEGIQGFFNNLASDLINKTMDVLGETLFSDTDFTKQQGLKATWSDNLKVSYGVLLIFFLIGTASAPLRELLDLDLFSLREIATRTVAAFVAASLSLEIAEWMLEFSSGITRWIMGQGVTVKDFNVWSAFLPGTGLTDSGTSGIGLALMFLLIGILTLILGVIYAIRDAALWYLIAYSPFFIVAWVIPQTEKIARVAFNILLGLLLLKFIHAGIIKAFFKMQIEGGTYEMFMSLAMVVLMYVIPGMLINLALMSGASGRVRNTVSMVTNVKKFFSAPKKVNHNGTV
ncbi:hypothetical protein CTH_10043 (plasmid) [Carboxydocella thermautotrophica]|nr:hypothetical protein CTH_10043 [Carboxydocella thermautotrophica]